ncbi:MAG: hypothetical protein DWI58_04860 [Chloroflexi bacterium]|nr:MAG: hypothetical protein DWI58_04860 [Chloroflexota bacterium]
MHLDAPLVHRCVRNTPATRTLHLARDADDPLRALHSSWSRVGSHSMQVVLCDICDTPIRGKAVEIHFIHGEAVHSEMRGTRIVSRDGTTMTFLCESCGQWTREAMEYLRQGYADSRFIGQPVAHAGAA